MGVSNETSFPSLERYERLIMNGKSAIIYTDFNSYLKRRERSCHRWPKCESLIEIFLELWRVMCETCWFLVLEAKEIDFDASKSNWLVGTTLPHVFSPSTRREIVKQTRFRYSIIRRNVIEQKSDKEKQRKAQKQIFSVWVFSDSCLISWISVFLLRVPFAYWKSWQRV